MHETKEIKQKNWEAEGIRLFGDRMRNWKFICPCCGTVQDGNDFLAAGASIETAKGMLGFSCIGRILPKRRGAFDKGPGPCDYAGGGLIGLNPVKIIRDTGEPIYYFDFYKGGK